MRGSLAQQGLFVTNSLRSFAFAKPLIGGKISHLCGIYFTLALVRPLLITAFSASTLWWSNLPALAATVILNEYNAVAPGHKLNAYPDNRFCGRLWG